MQGVLSSVSLTKSPCSILGRGRSFPRQLGTSVFCQVDKSLQQHLQLDATHRCPQQDTPPGIFHIIHCSHDGSGPKLHKGNSGEISITKRLCLKSPLLMGSITVRIIIEKSNDKNVTTVRVILNSERQKSMVAECSF